MGWNYKALSVAAVSSQNQIQLGANTSDQLLEWLREQRLQCHGEQAVETSVLKSQKFQEMQKYLTAFLECV